MSHTAAARLLKSSLCAVVIALAATFGAPVQHLAYAQEPAAAAIREDFGAQRDRVLALVNQARQAQGLRPVAASAPLQTAAQRYAVEMARTGCYSHFCGPVSDPVQRAAQAGHFGLVGENIAADYRDPALVVQAWLSSPSHRAVLLHANATTLGVGIAEGPAGIYWVQEFGSY